MSFLMDSSFKNYLFILTGTIHCGIFVYLTNKIKINVVKNILEHSIQIIPFILLCTSNIIKNINYITYPCLILMIINIFWCVKRIGAIPTYPIITETHRDLSMHRGIVYIMTCICIFARDLPEFRSKLGKSSYFGSGFMDVGIGFFVLHMGTKGYGNKWSTGEDNGKRKILLRIMAISGVLFLMGIIRYAILKITKLSYSPIEYGRDMNVFCVLSFVKLTGSILEIAFHKKVEPWKLSILMMIIYEIRLKSNIYSESNFNSYDFRLDKNVYVANIEFFNSLMGHLALFFSGRQIGIIFFERISSTNKLKSSSKMLITSIIIFFVKEFLIFENILEEESRRMCNLSYVLWMISIFLFGLFLTRIMMVYFESNFEGKYHYTERIDRMGFIYFIVGNIIVGVYRLCGIERSLPKWSSSIILYVYCSINVILSTFINKLLNMLYK